MLYIPTKLPYEDIVKAFDTVSALSNNFLHGSLKEKIFYLHIYKCGGTSIAQAIKSCYLDLENIENNFVFHLNRRAANEAINAIRRNLGNPELFSNHMYKDDLRLKLQESLLLYYMGREQTNYIAGHFGFSATAYQYFSNKYAFITVLREPVKRFISAYVYGRYREGRKHNMDLTEYLQAKTGFGGSTYVKLLGGLDETGDYTSERAIARAKENLHKFSVVGCLEYTEEFLKQFEERFGRKLKIRKYNQSPKSETYRNSILTEETEEKIREICKPDLEIYQYALDNFVRAKN